MKKGYKDCDEISNQAQLVILGSINSVNFSFQKWTPNSR